MDKTLKGHIYISWGGLKRHPGLLLAAFGHFMSNAAYADACSTDLPAGHTLNTWKACQLPIVQTHEGDTRCAVCSVGN